MIQFCVDVMMLAITTNTRSMRFASVLAAGATTYELYVTILYGRHEAYISWGARMRGLSLSDLACVTVSFLSKATRPPSLIMSTGSGSTIASKTSISIPVRACFCSLKLYKSPVS
ncbi:hypothetical protein PTI98_005978 [Pleurotus ostreatus]|nr:hypothetical protein PTI98_005978 [Pleurotus ostreatus]